MSSEKPSPLSAKSAAPLRGAPELPGDKSISHRAIMFAALAVGESKITGLLEGEDVMATAAAMRAMGATIEKRGEVWHVWGVGVGGLQQPAALLDMGNSGTSARLLMGLCAAHPITVEFTGDASLSRRPMKRVIDPLSQMGAQFESNDNKLPLTLRGTHMPMPITYELPVASAQVKSAILLAGLNTPGRTTVIERTPTRDYTEKMLASMGARVEMEDLDIGKAISVTGYAELKPLQIHVPRDPSSAAFPSVAALLVPGSEILLRAVGMNPTRTGLFTTLQEMGADIQRVEDRWEMGESISDLRVRYSKLNPVDVPAERAPSMIDEYPILAVACAAAHGTSRLRGLHELRAKESDRLQVMADGLAACGVRVEIDGDDLIIHGTGKIPGGANVTTHLDHRICMSFLVASLAAENPITIDDAAPIQTSFPNFIPMMENLGTKFYSSNR